MAQPGDVCGLAGQRDDHAIWPWPCFSGKLRGQRGVYRQLSLWLWFTVLFANFAEALAEGRSKAQANSLKGRAENQLGEARLRAPPMMRR